jgi:ACS family D-galactonate transporter-like MFS transporter
MQEGALPRHLWRVLVLLGLSVLINYIDRVNLSLAAPTIKDELGISASQLGLLFSAFFWTYACFQLVSGWLVDRYDANWVIAIGFFLWSMATAVTGVVHAFVALFVVRLVLGIGESVAYPSYSTILARHFPERHRGLANATISCGLALGPAVGSIAGGTLMARFGWRPFFIVLGCATMLWLAPWLKWMPRRQAAAAARHCVAMSAVLRQKSLWGTCIGQFSVNYLLYFLITWLPYYLVRERHFSMNRMAVIQGVAFVTLAISAPLGGWLSDQWIGAGASPTLARKTFMATGCLGSGVFYLLFGMADQRYAVMALILIMVMMGMGTSNCWAVTQTLAGPHASGRWTGIQNFIGNLAGVAVSASTGYILERTGHLFGAFVLLLGVGAIGALAWTLMVGELKRVEWTAAELGTALQPAAKAASGH